VENDEIQQLLKTGIEAAQGGNKIIARHILEQVVAKDPDSELGWLWLASVVDTVDERRNCLQKVLFINPNNDRARQALSKLPSATPAPAAAERPPEISGARATRAPTTARATPTTPPPERPPLFVPRERAARRRRGRIARPMFILLAVLAVGMIGLGLALLWMDTQNESKDETPTAARTATRGAVIRTPNVSAFSTSGPSPTPFVVETPGATWTPSNTPTPTNTPEPTATPLPLTTFSLAVSAQRSGQTNWSLYILAADGTDERKVLLSLAALGGENTDLILLDVYDATYSPDGVWLVFTGRLSEDGGETTFEDIFVAPAAGGDLRRITALAAEHAGDPTWSPDGQQIAFAANADGDYDIYTVSIDGGTPNPLTDNTAEDRYPAWSPDGQWIVYASDLNQPGTLEIWRMDPNGSSSKQLTDNQNSSFAPDWSPDSQEIVFVSDRRAYNDLYIMAADGGGERAVLVRDVSAAELDPVWSPDGQWIAFSSNRASAIYDVFVIRPDGTELQRLTTGDGDTRYVDWKP
jgi:Tol biopolymer transport system component